MKKDKKGKEFLKPLFLGGLTEWLFRKKLATLLWFKDTEFRKDSFRLRNGLRLGVLTAEKFDELYEKAVQESLYRIGYASPKTIKKNIEADEAFFEELDRIIAARQEQVEDKFRAMELEQFLKPKKQKEKKKAKKKPRKKSRK